MAALKDNLEHFLQLHRQLNGMLGPRECSRNFCSRGDADLVPIYELSPKFTPALEHICQRHRGRECSEDHGFQHVDLLDVPQRTVLFIGICDDFCQ
ncbi:MAG: hypothetical protein DSY81_00205 [Bacillota bacterium]|nr:MAG: hypothetical protein DSY81_00205 [Bacillota bacterium]